MARSALVNSLNKSVPYVNNTDTIGAKIQKDAIVQSTIIVLGDILKGTYVNMNMDSGLLCRNTSQSINKGLVWIQATQSVSVGF